MKNIPANPNPSNNKVVKCKSCGGQISADEGKTTSGMCVECYDLNFQSMFDPSAETSAKPVKPADGELYKGWDEPKSKPAAPANPPPAKPPTAPVKNEDDEDDDDKQVIAESREAISFVLQKAKAEIWNDPQGNAYYLNLDDESPLWSDKGGIIPSQKKGYILPLTDQIHTILREFGMTNVSLYKGKNKEGGSTYIPWVVSQDICRRLLEAFPTKEFNPHIDYYKKCADELPADLTNNPKMPRYLEEIWPDIVSAVEGNEDTISRAEAQWLVNWASLHLIVGQIAKSVITEYQTRETIIFAGSQNRGKRTTTRLLTPTYREMGIWDEAEHGAPFAEVEDVNADDKALAEREAGMKVVGLPEIVGIHKKTLEGLKQYLSKTRTHYRKAYGRLAQTQFRTCIVVGKTNKPASAVPNDLTGNTRFVPLNIGDKSNDPVSVLTADKRRILFGIGYLLWKSGVKPVMPRNKMELLNRLAERHSAMSEQYIAIEEILLNDDIAKKGEISTPDIKDRLRGKNTDAPSNNELADIMDRLGWGRKRIRRGGTQIRLWGKKRVRKSKSYRSTQ